MKFILGQESSTAESLLHHCTGYCLHKNKYQHPLFRWRDLYYGPLWKVGAWPVEAQSPVWVHKAIFPWDIKQERKKSPCFSPLAAAAIICPVCCTVSTHWREIYPGNGVWSPQRWRRTSVLVHFLLLWCLSEWVKAWAEPLNRMSSNSVDDTRKVIIPWSCSSEFHKLFSGERASIITAVNCVYNQTKINNAKAAIRGSICSCCANQSCKYE